MIRAILAGFGVAVAAFFVLLFVSVPGWTKPVCNNIDVMRPCAPTFQAERVSRKEARRIARGRELERRLPIGTALAPGESAAQFIRGRLVCARNVNALLAARGIRGTGSALARSFLHWGHSSRPVVNAVAYTPRRGGGHVAVVSRVEGGRVFVLNPSSRRQAWQEVEYTHRRATYRVAG